ncbi:MAG: TraB/GumN family protein, partial [Dongiaceae bacterium]
MHLHRLLAFLFIIVGVAGSRASLAEALPFSDGVLWRVERADGAASYVFGTLHSRDERVTALPQQVSDAFAASQTLAIECILDNPAILKVTRAMLLPRGERLDASLSAAQVARLKDVAADYHMPFTMVTRFKPWGAMMLFSVPPTEQLLAASGLKALDERLRAQAEAAGKAVFGLETVDEQIDALDGMVPTDQMLMLDATLQQAGDIESRFAALRDAYLARDLVTVYG